MNVIKSALLAFVFGVSNVMSKNFKPCGGNTPVNACAQDPARSPAPLIYIPPSDPNCALTPSEIPWCCPQGAISSKHPSTLAYAQAHGCIKRQPASQ
ncbi:uncharacterized protein PGTG_21161 [Puccinia graminis f. sp. tritici CRL 75-36-700-3]|uniref:CBM1 domain-containing protein n=1 Tax=Puccinia graminis f. sp. tritici (strain CRL 75-36-700-3 / race SCCL) TaxID=418459 RepID=H6QQK1_PUCGT|nr:uncharacterized protein PGTG_21161 [Puccinia graminis f. sp. tritici CRL 75-36-700-3]EHS62653.1 hypothetical protein PGTG_21161 [Puccinia graminis f. sp. tritici CRL 75-36-700-3]